MKRLLLISILFVSVFISLFAQDSLLNRNKLPKTLYYFDDFVDYRNKWFDNENSKSKFYTKNGRYYFQNKQEKNTRLTWHGFNIEPSGTYYVEMEFALAAGADNMGSGLLFNHTTTKKDNYYEFQIADNRYFIIRKYIDDEATDVVPWRPTWIVHTGVNNKLGILSKAGKWYFYINDILVHQMKRPAFIGNDIGFSAAEKSTLAVDKFTIRYNPLPVNNIPDGDREYKTENMGAEVNSELDDCFPVLSADGEMMFFSRCVNMGAIGLDRRTLMFSELNKATGKWLEAKALPPNINQGGLPQIVYISPDKNTLVINASYDKNGKYIIDEGLAISYRSATGWTVPENMQIKGWANKDHYESYSMSPNNKVLIMTLNTTGTYGQKDIYVSFKHGETWSEPQNLGAVVNSFGDENSPCLAPDNVTLYYSTDGKPGYGGSDLFVTRRLDDTWRNWTEPENLGPNINSRFGDGDLRVDAYGQYAYIDKYESKDSENEIYRFVLPESARPKPVVIVRGKVINMLTREPFSTSIIYENMESGEEEGTAKSNREDGSFVLVLPYGVNYGLTAKEKGYISESKNINLKEDSLKKGFAELTVELYVMPLTKGETVTLNNIFFGPDKYELEESSFAELDRLHDVMVENPVLEIEVDGHTDKGGENASQENLQILSQNRANSVRDYLISKGVEAKRINAFGFGNSKPASGNQSLNRRVEIKIINL